MLARKRRNDAPYMGAAGKIDLPHVDVLDELLRHRTCVFRPMEYQIQASVREPCLSKDVGDCPIAPR